MSFISMSNKYSHNSATNDSNALSAMLQVGFQFVMKAQKTWMNNPDMEVKNPGSYKTLYM